MSIPGKAQKYYDEQVNPECMDYEEDIKRAYIEGYRAALHTCTFLVQREFGEQGVELDTKKFELAASN